MTERVNGCNCLGQELKSTLSSVNNEVVPLKISFGETPLLFVFKEKFWEGLADKGKIFKASLSEEGEMRLVITPQALFEENRTLGRQLWEDLVRGFRETQKDANPWVEAYCFLYTILTAGYQGKEGSLKEILDRAEKIRLLDWQILSETSSFNLLADHLKKGGNLADLGLEWADLHLLTAGIFYGILPPDMRETLKANGLTPETFTAFKVDPLRQ